MNFSKLIYQSFTWRLGYYASLFLLNIFIARYFGAAASGEFNYLINIYALLILLASFSLEAAIGYQMSKDVLSLNDAIRFVFVWCLFTGLLLVPSGIILYKVISGAVYSADSIYTGSFYITGYLFIIFLQAFFYAKHDFRFPNIIAIGFNVLLIAFLLISSVLKIQPGIHLFFKIYAGSFLLQGALLWLLALQRHSIQLFGGFSFFAIKSLFRYAALVFMGNLIFFLVYRIDYWFVNRYCPDELLGNYIQVSKLVQLFLIIPSSIASVIFPVAAGGKIFMPEKIKQLSRVLVACFTGVLLVLALTGKWLFVWIFGNGFDKIYQPFLLLMPGTIALTVISLLGAYFGGRNMVRVNVTGAVLTLCIMITLDRLLVPVLLINGAAIASSISYTAYLAYMFYWFNKKEPVRVKEMFIVKRGDIQAFIQYVFKS